MPTAVADGGCRRRLRWSAGTVENRSVHAVEVRRVLGGSAALSIPTPDAETVDRIISIIRRDLMLGADADIDVQTKLFGSDFDMDSLDALLLMQSLEAEFGFKMASESFGPEVFESVSSLAGFVISRGVAPSRSPES